jgi:hypothetical protein
MTDDSVDQRGSQLDNHQEDLRKTSQEELLPRRSSRFYP